MFLVTASFVYRASSLLACSVGWAVDEVLVWQKERFGADPRWAALHASLLPTLDNWTQILDQETTIRLTFKQQTSFLFSCSLKSLTIFCGCPNLANLWSVYYISHKQIWLKTWWLRQTLPIFFIKGEQLFCLFFDWRDKALEVALGVKEGCLLLCHCWGCCWWHTVWTFFVVLKCGVSEGRWQMTPCFTAYTRELLFCHLFAYGACANASHVHHNF